MHESAVYAGLRLSLLKRSGSEVATEQVTCTDAGSLSVMWGSNGNGVTYSRSRTARVGKWINHSCLVCDPANSSPVYFATISRDPNLSKSRAGILLLNPSPISR